MVRPRQEHSRKRELRSKRLRGKTWLSSRHCRTGLFVFFFLISFFFIFFYLIIVIKKFASLPPVLHPKRNFNPTDVFISKAKLSSEEPQTATRSQLFVYPSGTSLHFLWDSSHLQRMNDLRKQRQKVWLENGAKSGANTRVNESFTRDSQRVSWTTHMVRSLERGWGWISVG